MFDYSLDILGNEWIIIIFVALVLILGTNQLPNA
ncbi:MAG: translocase, partial [Nitrosarchaeum sp.]